jgi:hypothetical protein
MYKQNTCTKSDFLNVPEVYNKTTLKYQVESPRAFSTIINYEFYNINQNTFLCDRFVRLHLQL